MDVYKPKLNLLDLIKKGIEEKENKRNKSTNDKNNKNKKQ